MVAMPFMNDEVSFSGKYSHSIFQTISMSIKDYRKKFIFCILLGFLGRAFLLVNANIIGRPFEPPAATRRHFSRYT